MPIISPRNLLGDGRAFINYIQYVFEVANYVNSEVKDVVVEAVLKVLRNLGLNREFQDFIREEGDFAVDLMVKVSTTYFIMNNLSICSHPATRQQQTCPLEVTISLSVFRSVYSICLHFRLYSDG